MKTFNFPILQFSALTISREELETIALDKCPAHALYDLRDDIDSTPDHDLINIIQGLTDENTR